MSYQTLTTRGKSALFIIFPDNFTAHYGLTFSCHLSEINNICHHRVTAWQSSTWTSVIVVYRLKLRTRILAEANKRCTVNLRKLASFCIFGCPGLFHGYWWNILDPRPYNIIWNCYTTWYRVETCYMRSMHSKLFLTNPIFACPTETFNYTVDLYWI